MTISGGGIYAWREDEDFIMHPEAYIVVAMTDTVGIACSSDCAQSCIDDIVADLGEEADAGMDVATSEQVSRFGSCMGCGKEVL